MEEGISHRNVQCVQQDEQGYIWIGTKYGLNRFDGYQFSWYSSENKPFQSGEINHILKDGKGIFWLIYTGAHNDFQVQSIDIFNPFTETVSTFEDYFEGEVDFAASDLKAFCQGKDGMLFLLTKDHRFVRFDSSFYSRRLDLGEKIPMDEMCQDSEGNIVLVKRNNIFPRDGFRMTIDGEILSSFSKTKNIKTCLPRYLLIDADEMGNIFKVILKNDGKQVADNLVLSFPELQFTTSWFRDSKNVLWFGTQFGLYRLKFQEKKFRSLLIDKKNPQGQDLRMRGMAVDKNRTLWALSENIGGLWSVDLATGIEEIRFPTSKTVQALTLLNNGNIMQDMGMDRFKFISTTSGESRTTHYAIDNEELIDYPIWTIYEDRYGQIWLGDSDCRQLRYIRDDSLHIVKDWISPSVSKFNLYQFLEEQGDTVWFVGSQGLIRFNIRTKKAIDWYRKDAEGQYNLPFDNIHHMHPEGDGSYWLATGGTGLVHWHPEQGVLDRYSRMDGMPNNTVYAVYEDKQENLWMPTDNGIACLNKQTAFILGFDEEEGLSHYEFNRIAHCRDLQGNLYFGSLRGITAFNPDSVLQQAEVVNPPLVINRFEQFDGKAGKLIDRTSQLRQQNQITMQPNDRFFKLEFSLLTFEDVEKIRYAFKINSEKNWNLQRENVLRFSRLPYGDHVIHIRGQAGNGKWSDQELAIRLKVLKPLYFQSWFLVCAILLIAMAVVLYFRYRTAKLKKQKRILEETVEARTETIRKQAEALKSLEQLKSRFFTNVSHELRTPLTLMLGPVQSLLKREGRDPESRKLLEFVQRNGRKLQTLINEILDLAKLEDNKLQLKAEPVHFHPYIVEHMAQFHSFASSDKLNFNIQYEADDSLWLMLDKSKFEKVIDNFISNAMKYSPEGGTVIFSIKQTEQHLLFEVSDEGKGIHPDDLPHIFDRFYQSKQDDAKTEGGTGIGLSLSKELAELMEGKVWATSEPGNGSSFFFQLPIVIAEPVSRANLVEQDRMVEISSGIDLKNKPGRNGKDRILLVEDNPDLREYLSFLLADFNIHTTENGAVAWNYLQTKREVPDLIISDLMMPVMDGMQLLENLKGDDRFRHIPTIMLTAKANLGTRISALRIGVDDYLTKPFQEEELKARIVNLLSRHRERVELYQEEVTLGQEEDKSVVTRADAEWLTNLESLIEQNLIEPGFKVDSAAEMVNLSVRQFRRKVKQLTGLSPSQYIQEMRLNAARNFLEQGHFLSVKETCQYFGFSDVRYFSSIFQKRFGVLPSEMLKD